MATTATGFVGNGDADIVRPRPRKPTALHNLVRQESSAAESTLSVPDSIASVATR